MMKYSVVMPIKIDHEWQRIMTQAALDILAATTEQEFELLVVECQTNYFEDWNDVGHGKSVVYPNVHYRHLIITDPTSANDELNQGVQLVGGDYVIYTQNDIFVKPGWLEALQQCFDECPDCGVATLASSDLRDKLQIPMPCDKIIEGVYGPFMMWERGWTFDADTFPANFCDSDLVMRIYESGKRSYRNFRVVIDHINQATTRGPEHDKDFTEARQRFIAKHQDSSLLMFQILAGGQIV